MVKSDSYERIVVVGGGIAGLTAAAYLGRAGLSVTLFESSPQLGGRAATQELGGFYFNFGARALYKLGAARRAFLDLGIEIPGSPPPSKGLYAVLDQLRLAIRANVVYVHDGWKTLVRGLTATIEAAGGEIRLGAEVEALLADDGLSAVRLSGGEVIDATDIVLALPPGMASRLAAPLGGQVPEPEDLHPVRAACLDLGLSELPRTDRLFALGLDRPTYLSVHSTTARLAPKGKALVHLLWYLGDETPGRQEAVTELEGLMDLVQPGWREVVEERRMMPEMVVAHALVQAGKPRPEIDSSAVERLWLAGDWVGEEGMLADGAAASGRLVEEQIQETR
jgi:phytoene dehydrogenase-like protein